MIAKTGTRVVADSFAFDSAGVVAARWNQNLRDSIAADANGWITSVVRRFATDPTKRFVLSYTADSLHRLLSMTPSTNAGITFATRAYSWDNATGVLNGITVGGASVGMGYDSDLIRSSAIMPSGLTRNESKATIHTLFQLGFSASGVDQYLWRRVKLDGPGRVLEAYAPDGSNVWKSAFKYDVMGRLVQAADSGIIYQNQCDFPVDPDYGSRLCTGYTASQMRSDTWTYDAVGNVTAIAGTAGTGSVTYATGNRLASWPGYTYSHDLDGNITRRDTTGSHIDYTWTADGFLTSVIAGTDTTFYDYDTGGLLARKRKGNAVVSRHFWWDGAQLVAELDSLLTSRVGEYAYYPGADKPLALVTGATTITNKYFYQEDALGSAYGLVAEDGTLVRFSGGHVPWGERSQWSSFGATPADANRLTWKGLMLESGNTNLYYVRARWYDPKTHRFISEDAIGIAGGINPYAYAANDPVNGSDPSGLRYCLDEQRQMGYWDYTGENGSTWCIPPDGIGYLAPMIITAPAPFGPRPGGLGGRDGNSCAVVGNCRETASAFALQLINDGWKYAIKGPAKTIDCSHYCQQLQRAQGCMVPYVSTGQMASSSAYTRISASEARAGDIIVRPASPFGHMGQIVGSNSEGDWIVSDWGRRMNTHKTIFSYWGPGATARGWFKGELSSFQYYRPKC